MADQAVGTPRSGVASAEEADPSDPSEPAMSSVPSSGDDPRDAAVLAKVQEKLRKQLLDRKVELDERVYEQKRNLVRATKDREEAGVQLYDLQCNLAGLHLNLHKATATLATAAEGHTKAREEMAQVQKHYDLREGEYKALQEKTATTRQELDTVQNTLKKLEGFNERMKGDIQLNRRSTYATEEAVVRAERDKKEQDILINEMQQRIKHLHEKVALTKAQLAAQERETKVANVALREADVEMEAINSEKKQITFQWKSSLIVLSRCDEALQTIMAAIHLQKEQMISIAGEKNNYRKIIVVEEERAERQGINLMKIDSAMKEVQKHINRTTKKRAKMLEQYAKILVKLEKIEAEVEKVKVVLVTMQEEIKETNKQYLKETAKIHELENRILTGLLEQITLEKKSAQATVASVAELRKLVKQEDTMATEINYELSRIRCDLLAVMAYNQNVNAALKAVNDDVNAKFSLISKLEAEIKRKHQEVDMKTKEIARLNKQYDKLTRGLTSDASTPWEAMINSLKSEIDIKLKASSALQKRWLSLQTSLVALQNENNNLSEKSQQMSHQQGVLVQRKHRVDNQSDMLLKAIKELNMGIRVKQNLIIRLNDLIGKNASLENSLSKENENLQIDHYIALKDLAKETMEMQVQLEEQRTEKGHALKHMDELEHHVMLWRYKISFEIQTQAAIDPNVGQAALTAMKKATDRMEVQLNGLILQRKKLIVGLESRVDNRKTISSKIEAMSQRKGFDGPAGLEAGLVKASADLKKAIKDTDKSAVELDKRLIELEEQRITMNTKATELNEKVAAIISQQEDCREQLRTVSNARARALLATAMYQRIARRHEEAKSNKWRGVSLKKSLDEDLKDVQLKCTHVLQLVAALTEELPPLQQKLDIMAIQMELVLKAPS